LSIQKLDTRIKPYHEREREKQTLRERERERKRERESEIARENECVMKRERESVKSEKKKEIFSILFLSPLVDLDQIKDKKISVFLHFLTSHRKLS
jgi:hypothetical protein